MSGAAARTLKKSKKEIKMIRRIWGLCIDKKSIIKTLITEIRII